MSTAVVNPAAASTAAAASSSPLLSTTFKLIVLQLVSRLFSFSLNQLLLRSTTPQALGVATMGFEVVRDTGLFLLREGLRGAVVVSCRSTSSPRPIADSPIRFGNSVPALSPLRPHRLVWRKLSTCQRISRPSYPSFSSSTLPSALLPIRQHTSTQPSPFTPSQRCSNYSLNDGTSIPFCTGRR